MRTHLRNATRPRHPSAIRRLSRAFTLTEVLVAVAIIALLATIVIVVSGRAFKTADRTRIGYQLQTVEQALEAYKTEFNNYPLTNVLNATSANSLKLNEPGLRGARTLCKALIGPGPAINGTVAAYNANNQDQDGATGPGFRVPSRSGVPQFDTSVTPNELTGKKYAFLSNDAFKVSNTYSAVTGGTAPTGTQKLGDPIENAPAGSYDDTAVILDANGKPILYFPVINPQPAFATPDAFVSAGKGETSTYTGASMFRSTDNEEWLLPTVLRKELGCGPALPYGTDASTQFNPKSPGSTQLTDNRALSGNETAVAKGKYILWSAGPDGIYGPDMNAKKPNDLDDVTNFQQQQ